MNYRNNVFLRSTLINLIIVIGLIGIYSCTYLSSDSKSNESPLMKKALPVWVEGRQEEMNLSLGFRGIFNARENNNYTLRITASTLYRVYLNGEFLGYGPARAAHGYFRVDEYDLGDLVNKGDNLIAVEVAGYNINTYYTLDQPSFLQAEVDVEGKILIATGSSDDFEVFQISERRQKVERYSFQRPFTEYYSLGINSGLWRSSLEVSAAPLILSHQPGVKLLPRNLLLPEFKMVHPASVYSKGSIQLIKPEVYKRDRSLTRISEKLKGFKEEEIDIFPSRTSQEIFNKVHDTLSKAFTGEPLSLSENEFYTFDFGINLTGFIGGKISCPEPSKLIFYFDEILTEGDVNTKKRMGDINNQVVYELEAGDYNIETFEAYTFKFLKVILLKGKCQINGIYLREYTYPENPLAAFNCSNHKLNEIYKAARQTLRQNSVDILMDCPSRERAGWLCDSYFSAIAEKDFTGKSSVTHNFYESYAMADSFPFLPEGMIPMCYPADHNDGVFIPTWALWFIIQIDDYIMRGGDPVLAANIKPRIEKLLDYFSRFENEDGLLEKLDSWIFVEWSKANSFVRDVNYPANMLYSAALTKAANLYNNESWLKKAGLIRETVLKQSFNGNFFVDNAVRDSSGKLLLTKNTTEVCQYYAFFFNFATPESHPGLWKKLITEFGPNRNDILTYPEVFRANAFMGNYMRMDILSRYELQSQLLNEIQDYFYYMARTTGTLWEHTSHHASCNHGFTSYLGHIIYRDILGISKIDYLRKEVTIQFNDIGLEECSGTLPLNESFIDLKWKRKGGQIHYSIQVPEDFKVVYKNNSPYELINP